MSIPTKAAGWSHYVAALILLSQTTSVLALDGLAEDPGYRFAGPAPTRNFHPIQLIFLQLPFEGARVVSIGEWQLDFETTESDVIGTSTGRIESRLKFETNRTVFGLRYGILDRVEVGIHLPFLTRYGGFLDGFIDGVESLVGLRNVERSLYPDNSFGEFRVRRGDTDLLRAGQVGFELGDLWFSGKLEVPLEEKWPTTSLRFGLKLPSGNRHQAVGSGKPDFGIGVALQEQLFSRLFVYANANLVYPIGPIKPAAGAISLKPMFSQALALELALTERWTTFLHQAFYTSPIRGSGASLLEGEVLELGLGLNFTPRRGLTFQLFGVNNLSGVERGADFSLMLAMKVRLPRTE